METQKNIYRVMLTLCCFAFNYVYAGVAVYNVNAIDLGVLPGANKSSAKDINPNGLVVGESKILSGETRGFVWDPATNSMTNIGTLPGANYSSALSINHKDEVTGNAKFPAGSTGNSVSHAFRWKNGSFVDLGPHTAGVAINNYSQLAGTRFNAGPSSSEAVAWSVDLPWLPYVSAGWPAQNNSDIKDTLAADINDLGNIAGTMTTWDQAYRMNGNSFELLVRADIFGTNFANAINDLGQVVGRAEYPSLGGVRAGCCAEPSTAINLGILDGYGSIAYDINNAGIIVGSTSSANGERGFVWHPNFGMQALEAIKPGGISSAFGINAEGQIVGESESTNGDTHATLWDVTYGFNHPFSLFVPKNITYIYATIPGSDYLDVTKINAKSVKLGPLKASPFSYKYADSNNDGNMDLVLTYATKYTGIDLSSDSQWVSIEGRVGRSKFVGTKEVLSFN